MTPEEFIETLGNKVKCIVSVLIPVLKVSNSRSHDLLKGYFSLTKKKKNHAFISSNIFVGVMK